MALVGGENGESLTDEDPEYDRRKEKVGERLQRRDQERQQGVERRKHQKEVQTAKMEKIRFFTSTFTGERSGVEVLLAACGGLDRAAMAGHFQRVSAKMQQLQKLLNDYLMFLSAYDQRQAQEALQRLQASVAEKRDECLPKKKFSFKSRKKLNPGPASAASVGPVAVSSSSSGSKAAAAAGRDSDPIPNPCGFSDVDSQLLVGRAEEINGRDVLLNRLSNCVVKLLGSPNTLHIKNLTDTKVLCGPVSTSVFVDQSVGCTFAVACQQLRTHNTKDAKVYLHVTSRAIIEDCSGVSFAPFNWEYDGIEKDFELAGLDRTRNNWDDVDDFNWLASDHSPNWRVLAEESRITDWDKSLSP